MSAMPSVLSDETTRKRMRKGTHSCTECRRRKKSCVMPPNGEKCTECIERGVECLSQESRPLKQPRIESKQALQVRIARLETVVQSVVDRLDTNQKVRGTSNLVDASTSLNNSLKSSNGVTQPLPSELTPSSPISEASTQDAGM